MAIHYQCKHCSLELGKIEADGLSTTQLGFNHLTESERQEMLMHDNEGNIYVKTICEDCQEALEKNPDFHQLENFIQ